MIQFQEYFQSDYPGFASFIDIIIKPIFGDSFKEVEYIEDMIDCLNDDPDELECYDEIEKSDENLKKLAKESGLQRILKLGTIKVQGGIRPIYVYDITVSKRRLLSRNRKGIQQLISRTLSNQSGAFMLFHYEDAKWEWRFSYKFVGKDQNDSTNSKRFTYLFGKNQVCKTAAQRFTKLLNKKCEIAIDDITDAFSVEALSKEFFDTYKAHYEHFCQFVYDNKSDRYFFGEEFSKWEDKTIRDYVKKLLGRIVFLHFLQKKGWMGVPTNKQWGEGDSQFMKNLYDSCSNELKANYLDDILEPMFEDLNSKRTDDIASEWSQSYSIAERKGGIKIPYLNGGLFERESTDTPKSVFPADYFEDLFDFFNQYNFTIDENDPNDAEVGIDPEMLGRIFENLLEDNKDKGAFYTPKEIVQYMCRESLIAYLQTDVEEESKETYRQFVTTHEVNELRPADVFKVDKKLREVKICDPAIGSGAFPMGLLKELFDCRMAIEGQDNGKSPAEIKKDIIQNSIYGVDIEKGAVDIARLRFWLSLIIDEQTPNALPNMDFKIMQGNSLLEQYNGFDLGTIMHSKKKVEGPVQMTLFEDDVDVLRRQVIGLRREYFRETNKQKKKDLRQQMREIVQQQINALSYNIDLSGIDIAENSEFFLWHTWFSDVFDNGGFDIVIGNPPYITMTKNNTDNNLLKVYNNNFVSIKKCYSKNIYTLFIEFGICTLLAKNGIISYIIPEGLFKTRSYEDCVSMMKKNGDLLSYSTFNNYVFENAVTGSLIFNYRKAIQGILPTHYAFDEKYNISIIPEEDTTLLDKISKGTQKLKDIAELFKGMVVKDRQEVVSETKEDNPDIFLLGKSISKWIVKTPYYTDYDRLTIIGGTKKKSKHDVAPRILIRRTGDTLCCLIIDKPALTESTLYSCWSKDDSIDNRYLIGVLNSTLLDYYNKKKNITNQQGFPQILMTDLQGLPIKMATKDQQQQIITLVDQISSIKKQAPEADIFSLEREIDKLVYRLYGLTEDEIQIIENKE